MQTYRAIFTTQYLNFNQLINCTHINFRREDIVLLLCTMRYLTTICVYQQLCFHLKHWHQKCLHNSRFMYIRLWMSQNKSFKFHKYTPTTPSRTSPTYTHRQIENWSNAINAKIHEVLKYRSVVDANILSHSI